MPASWPLGNVPELRPPAFKFVSREPSPAKLPMKELAELVSRLTPLKAFVPASEAAPRFDGALDAVPAPVPPWETDNGVSKADNAVMSELAPLAAAPSVARAPEGVPAPVPPRASGTTPLPRLPAFKPTKIGRASCRVGAESSVGVVSLIR